MPFVFAVCVCVPRLPLTFPARHPIPSLRVSPYPFPISLSLTSLPFPVLHLYPRAVVVVDRARQLYPTSAAPRFHFFVSRFVLFRFFIPPSSLPLLTFVLAFIFELVVPLRLLPPSYPRPCSLIAVCPSRFRRRTHCVSRIPRSLNPLGSQGFLWLALGLLRGCQRVERVEWVNGRKGRIREYGQTLGTLRVPRCGKYARVRARSVVVVVGDSGDSPFVPFRSFFLTFSFSFRFPRFLSFGFVVSRSTFPRGCLCTCEPSRV